MKTLGIVTEYNPFHKGHAYMIEEAKKKAGADRVVVVMSGSFVQRGEPAIFDKWTRTEAALKNGVDMVLELPVLFAASNAETFARAAVRTLEETGIVDVLCFGSESGDLHSMQEAARLIAGEHCWVARDERQLLQELALMMRTEQLRPKTVVDYCREAFVCEAGNVRVTLDMNIASSPDIGSFLNERIRRRPVMPAGRQLLEVKYDEYLPDFIYRSLQLENLQQTAFSKYYLCRRFTR